MPLKVKKISKRMGESKRKFQRKKKEHLEKGGLRERV